MLDWQRKYKEKSLSALSDKKGVTSLPKWAQEEAIKLWRKMGSGYFNRMQLWRELHMLTPLYLNAESARDKKSKADNIIGNDTINSYSYEKFLKCEIPPLFPLNTLIAF